MGIRRIGVFITVDLDDTKPEESFDIQPRYI